MRSTRVEINLTKFNPNNHRRQQNVCIVFVPYLRARMCWMVENLIPRQLRTHIQYRTLTDFYRDFLQFTVFQRLIRKMPFKLEESSKPKTSFTVPNWPLYQFTRMPFGLCNAPITLCRLMDMVIPYNLKTYVFVYLDDLLGVSQSLDEHLTHLMQIALVQL